MSDLTRSLRGRDEACGSRCRVQWVSHFARLTFCVAFTTLCNADEIGASRDAEFAGEVIDEIVVTGSRIKRRDFNTATPLTTIDSEVIDFSSQATIEETLNQMPQVRPVSARTSNNFGDGRATVDLRGLGPGRSLVMLNGRRVAPSGIDNAAPMRSFIYGVQNPDLAIPVVDDEFYVDLGLAYEFSDGFTTHLGVNNVMDNDPPQMAEQSPNYNTDTGLYDIFGRSFYLTLSMHF